MQWCYILCVWWVLGGGEVNKMLVCILMWWIVKTIGFFLKHRHRCWWQNDWSSNPGPCSLECGGGDQRTYRSCTDPAPRVSWHWHWHPSPRNKNPKCKKSMTLEMTRTYGLNRQNTEWRTILRGPTLWETTVQHPSLSSARGLTSQIFPNFFSQILQQSGCNSFSNNAAGCNCLTKRATSLVNF